MLPVFAAYEIYKDRLAEIVVEYYKDVVQMDADLAAYRESSQGRQNKKAGCQSALFK